ncbi:tubulin-tyrosine ligase family-domain-containing protein [Entophlyctis helioformis]|nr:tubulin-tyrosine ligase family-domain-containing protein [Entophlyctis helioformis]
MASTAGMVDRPRLVFKMAETGPNLLREVLENKGWVPYVEGETPYWNLAWKGSRFRKFEYEQCQPFQRLNHFPNTIVITRKDSLFRLLRTLKGIYGSAYDYFPVTFTVPGEFIRFVRFFTTEREAGSQSTWICKPADLSRGRGIFVFKELHELTYDCNAVVQRYIPNPLLISGYKFDMRCYVLVRSYSPLTVYLYDDGLARFATSRYDMSSLKNRFSHLTNTSINKFSPTLDTNKDEIGPGCKWQFSRLRAYFEQRGMDFGKVWDRIKGMIILTLLPVANQVTIHSESCFELYGFDILIDESMKTWLLEVNLSPALSVDADIDVLVKKPLLEDIISLVGIGDDDGERAMKHTQSLLSPPTRRKRWISDGKPSSTSSLPTLLPSIASRKYQHPTRDFPSQVGKFACIFPTPSLSKLMTCNQIPRAGDPQLKQMVAEIRRSYFR